MSERIHGLAQLLPDKTSLKDYSLEELQHLTKRFPYFAPAQFLLLQKLKETGSPAYDLQQSKAVLYFHDPLLFDYFTSAGKFLMNENEGPSVEASDAHKKEKTEPSVHHENLSKRVEVHEEKLEEASATLPEQQDTAVQPSSIKNEPIISEPDTVNEAAGNETAAPVVLAGAPLTEVTPTATNKEFAAEPVDENPEKENDFIAATDRPEPVQEKPSMVNQGQPAKPVATAALAESLVFEPFHTVDYFASQGIKISSEGLPKDKLSQQLRSFTEWLKVMKRLPAAGIEAAPHTTAEKTVENLASHSVEGSDVVTEAMAEVWARQGNKAKAMETYNKLSLLNPSKKAYFAAKIENLTGT